ncbi:Protein FANTASTIC FOUR 3 [Linum perenne]
MSSSSSSSFLDPTRELEPRILRLRLATPPDPEPDNAGSGLSFLQCLAAKETNYRDDQSVYSTNRSSSSLSRQSLEMCTESLGSETGTDDHYSSDDEMIALISPAPENLSCSVSLNPGSAPDSSSNNNDSAITSGGNWTQRIEKRRRNKKTVLPPPLTSIGRSGGVQMRSRREDGRLVLTAVSVSSSRGNFQAERSNGRLRLRLTTTDHRVEEEETEDEKTEEEKTEDGKTEKEEQRNRGGRCKEAGGGNRGLMNHPWGPFWVAI